VFSSALKPVEAYFAVSAVSFIVGIVAVMHGKVMLMRAVAFLRAFFTVPFNLVIIGKIAVMRRYGHFIDALQTATGFTGQSVYGGLHPSRFSTFRMQLSSL